MTSVSAGHYERQRIETNIEQRVKPREVKVDISKASQQNGQSCIKIGLKL